ncbi:kelch repeat protein [Teladorsagia circumcincta]|uniref:Kelch repeat protein n=1 Tax=Teladorsagia circumcincta TaxID=45464 RepID=A0A2G9UD18_TELCI|nr:kelch repeat protein [Teladorsagia circumcincta]
MPTYRESCGVASLDGYLYAVGGIRGCEYLNVVERYDPHRDEWTHMAPMRSRRHGASVSVVGGCLYAAGGLDPRVGRWEDVCPMSTRRALSGSAMFDGDLYVAGGFDEEGETSVSRRPEAGVGVIRKPCDPEQ